MADASISERKARLEEQIQELGVPPFWKPHPEIRGSLERLYSKVTERAMALAYRGRAAKDPDAES